VETKADQRAALRGWAPGGDSRKCHYCEEMFSGDTFAIECAKCAYTHHYENTSVSSCREVKHDDLTGALHTVVAAVINNILWNTGVNIPKKENDELVFSMVRVSEMAPKFTNSILGIELKEFVEAQKVTV